MLYSDKHFDTKGVFYCCRPRLVGPYKLVQQIGEGGFGVVYRAQQHHPIERAVALKMIKPGMDSREIMSRFKAERRALAMMDHPNIAQVLDAGRTESGRLYFVMARVQAVPITDYRLPIIPIGTN